jgi:hypothetical protein
LFATRFGLISRSANVKTIAEKFEDTPSLSGSESVSGEHSVLSKKSESGLRRYFYDTLASYLSLYIRPTDQVVGLRPATALRHSEKSACKYTAHNVTRAAATQLE